MQFPVPQFTDVEDKIIGPLTIKQFGIIFGAGVVVFLGYSASKSMIVLVFLALIIGLPALGLAFARPNGRPMYNAIGYFFKFFTSPRVLIFHKEINNLKTADNLKDMNPSQPVKEVPKPVEDTQVHMRQIQDLLKKTAIEEEDVVDKMK